MTNTPYYNLKKPGLGENALITDLNTNSDIIDTALKANADGLAGKVNAEDGKGLSTNDYTTAEKNKLARLKENAEYLKGGTFTGDIDALFGVGKTGTYWIQSSYARGTQPFGNGSDIYYYLEIIQASDTIAIQRATQFASYKNNKKEIAYRFRVNNRWYEWENISTNEHLSQGRNLLSLPYNDGMSKTTNGITFTVNEDGSITASGTATANVVFYLKKSSIDIKAGDIFSIHGCPEGGSSSTYAFYLTRGEFYQTYASDYGKGASYISSETPISLCSIAIRIFAGTTVENLTFYPMFERGLVRHEYEPVSESNASLKYAIDNTVGGDAWLSPKNYAVGDYAIYNNSLWKCLVQNSNQTPKNGTYWTKISVVDIVKKLDYKNTGGESIYTYDISSSIWNGAIVRTLSILEKQYNTCTMTIMYNEMPANSSITLNFGAGNSTSAQANSSSFHSRRTVVLKNESAYVNEVCETITLCTVDSMYIKMDWLGSFNYSGTTPNIVINFKFNN